MKIVFFFIFTVFINVSLCAQYSDDEKAVKQVILDVFDAMRESDSIKLKSCFHEEVNFFTAFIHPKNGNVLQQGNFQQFITSVGTPHDGIYDEKLGEYTIHVDSPLASIAVDYYFYIDETFSHCGVDYIQLFKQDGKWKIFFLSDTRRKEPCKLPDKTW